MLLGTLEAGGTKMVMGLADADCHIIKRESCPTRLPEETLADIIAFFEPHKIDALGIATFGPVDLRPSSASFGSIINTPKLAWRNFPLYRRLKEALQVPCAIDTDVNGAALAEARMGAVKGLENCVYFTIGTGIGGGVLSDGRLVHGMIHPEWGHTPIARHPEDPLTRGVCPYHENCAEGLAAGPSMQARWGVPAQELPEGHFAWELEAYYLAQLCITAMMTVSPERIVLGGGVMGRSSLYPMVREKANQLLGGYLASPTPEEMEAFIVPPALWPDSGLIGGALLAKDLLKA